MADLRFRPLTAALGEGRERLGQFCLRGVVRLLGALGMAFLLMLNRTWPVPATVYLGTAVLALVAGLMLRAHLSATASSVRERRRDERLIWLTALLAVGGVQIAGLLADPAAMGRASFLLMAPLVAQSMLVAALLTPGAGLVALSMSVLLMGLPGVIPMDVLAGAWLAGAVAAHVVNPLKQRSDLIRAMSLLVLAQAVIAAGTSWIQESVTTPFWEAAVWGAVAAVGATAVFWLGVAVLEKLFHIVSDWTLLELCSPEQPLLKELVLRAPGTYAHSVGVGNLAEAAARAVGANALLCRTMAFYHDVGKTVRPNYFIENQVGENVHDDLSPGLSAQIITAHVTDGVQLARAARLPDVIVDSVEQHHGTTLISYFYHRDLAEKGLAPHADLEKRFRYPGPKPQTRESAILHLADIVEAASRVMPRDVDIADFVGGLIEASRADGQLDESELTFRDLQVIARSFVRTLSALRHERVVYPSGAGRESGGGVSEEGEDEEGGSRGDREQAVSPRRRSAGA